MDYLIKMNGKKQAVLCVLLSVMIGISMFMVSASTVESINDESGFYVTLDISQYRDDVLLERRVIENDYILRNFAYLWLHMLCGDRYLDAITDYKTIDIDNVERAGKVATVFFDHDFGMIRIGTDSTPVAVTDYHLGTEAFQKVVDDAEIWYSSNEFNVTFDATIVSDGSYTITEAGLSAKYADTTSSLYHTLMNRDVFAGIAIVNGDVLVIRYIYRFNVGL